MGPSVSCQCGERRANIRPMTDETDNKPAEGAAPAFKKVTDQKPTVDDKVLPKEIGGTDGPEPTRYGDWERKGIASDF